jgi:hypothetical protein
LAKPCPKELSKRRTLSPEFKARGAMEAISGRKTIQKIAADNAIHPIPTCTSSEFAVLAQLSACNHKRRRGAIAISALQSRPPRVLPIYGHKGIVSAQAIEELRNGLGLVALTPGERLLRQLAL